MSEEQLPEGWKWKNLGEEFKIITGGTPPKSDGKNYGNDIPFIKPPDLTQRSIHKAGDSISNFGAAKARILPKDSVLVSCIGNLGKVGINRVPAAFNQQINAIIVSNKHCAEWVFYYCQSYEFRFKLEGLSSATTIPIVNKSKFESINIPLPPLPIQQQIVAKIEELFSELDAGVQELQTALARLKTYRQAVLHHYLNNPDWERVKLGEVVEQMQYGTSDKAEYNETGVPVIRMGNIQEGRLSFSNLKYFPPAYLEIDKYTLNAGDILFNRTNSAELVGKTAVFREGFPKSIFASYLIRLKVNSVVYNPNFLSLYINSIFGRNFIKSVVSQNVGQANVNGSKLKSFIVPIPDLPTQNQIVAEIEERLSEADAMETTLRNELKRAENLRQSILKQAFTGKLVENKVTEPINIQVAGATKDLPNRMNEFGQLSIF